MAVTTVASHDGKTLLILTSGFNTLADQAGKKDAAASNEYVFVFDIARHAPAQDRRSSRFPNTDIGIAFAPDDQHFYVSGGVDDFCMSMRERRTAGRKTARPIAFGHKTGLRHHDKPSAAGLAVSQDGGNVVVADRHNDAITIVDAKTRAK